MPEAFVIPKRAMAIFAHPDDVDFGCSGTLGSWIATAGTHVTYCVITSGQKGTHDPKASPEEMAETREREQRAAGAAIGVKEFVFLGRQDGELERSMALRGEWLRGAHALVGEEHRVDLEDGRGGGFPLHRARLTSPAMAEERSLGGNLNEAVRVGDTVRRRAGRWTPAVHALLRFLEREGFDAPRALGVDEQGREVLEYIEREAHPGNPVPLPDTVFAEEHMTAAARLLRRYHDLVTRFVAPPDARWRLVGPEPHEIICHNDWSPWNALFRNGSFALTLDWDL